MTTAKTHQVVHGSFTLERTYPADLSRVFAAFTSKDAKSQWFGEPDAPGYSLDFRVGGLETNLGEHGGTVYKYVATFADIVADNRIITTYEMFANDDRISVSVAAYEFFPEAESTRLMLTEHGTFLDGLDTNEQRREGTEQLLGAIETALLEGRI